MACFACENADYRPLGACEEVALARINLSVNDRVLILEQEDIYGKFPQIANYPLGTAIGDALSSL